MNRRHFFWLIGLLAFGIADAQTAQLQPRSGPARRVVILKIDGLNADLLYRNMRETDPATGKSRLPWFSHVFAEHGVVFENFYTRGISLSAPSWSMLDTGHHLVIRGNVEYDRFTGHVYDYLNFFPFYISYARLHQVDMPGVEVLDRAGISLLSDAFAYSQRFQSFQLFQRGVRWPTIEHVLERRFSSKVLFSMLESAGTPSLDELLARETEAELTGRLAQADILYLDFYSGDIDHQGHATNDPAALLDSLRTMDALAGRLWTAIQASPLAGETLFAVVSDHGMNNVPGVFSQTFSLPDLLNSAAGGGHHVITNRHQLSDYKLLGLNPLVQRATTPSSASFYLQGQGDTYPTAWLDLDGNERAAVHLRNSGLNKIHILLLELRKPDLPAPVRQAAATCLNETIERHRAGWNKTAVELNEEMAGLQQAIEERAKIIERLPNKWTAQQRQRGEDKQARRLLQEFAHWQREHSEYTRYLAHLRNLMQLQADPQHPFRDNVSDFVQELSLGDNNSVADLEHYVAGPAPGGLVVKEGGGLDEERSFRFINYFSLLAEQRVHNNPQSALSSRPVDFTAMSLPEARSALNSAVYDANVNGAQQAYWVYGDDESQLMILVDRGGRIAVKPIRALTQNESGKLHWSVQEWRAGLPLHLLEDTELQLPVGAARLDWLSQWHSEREWFDAIHLTEYSNAVIGITEELSPVADNVPGPPGISPILLRYERHRRELVQADFHVFAADHWNFNVRNFNPGGNHGAFFRISTHSVWMMAGAGLPTRTVSEPYDSLNFASTILSLLGRPAPMPEKVVH